MPAHIRQGSLCCAAQVHRRLLHDDGKGIGDPLNETGVSGKGLIARGAHTQSHSYLQAAALLVLLHCAFRLNQVGEGGNVGRSLIRKARIDPIPNGLHRHTHHRSTVARELESSAPRARRPALLAPDALIRCSEQRGTVRIHYNTLLVL